MGLHIPGPRVSDEAVGEFAMPSIIETFDKRTSKTSGARSGPSSRMQAPILSGRPACLSA